MKTIKMRTLTLSLALAVVLGMVGVASAQYYGPMGGYGLTPEKQASVQKLQSEHYAATAQLRQQIFAKQSELNAQLYGGHPDDKRVETLGKEIGALRAKLIEANVNMRSQMAKLGVPVGGMGGRGGHGMNGNGMGYGMGGGMGGGYGMGTSCGL